MVASSINYTPAEAKALPVQGALALVIKSWITMLLTAFWVTS